VVAGVDAASANQMQQLLVTQSASERQIT